MKRRTPPLADAQRRRMRRLAILLLAGSLGLGFFYHYPQWKRYQQHQQQLEQLRQQALALQEQNLQLTRVQDKLQQTQRFLAQQHSRHLLISAEELVAGLVGVFSGKEVQIRQFRRREVRNRSFLQEVWVDVECQGTLPEVFEVVVALEQMAQPVWIEQLQLVPAEQSPQHVRCHLILRGFAGNLQQSG